MTTNIVTTLVGYLVTVGVALLWVFLSKQRRIPRTCRTAACVSLRTLPLFVLFFLVCRQSGVSAIFGTAVLGIVLWILLIGFDPLSFGAVGILYVLQQWILGWPDRADFMLDPPVPGEDSGVHLDELIGKIGVASCPLRPGGMITIGEDVYPAHSDLGYIDRGTLVRVVGTKGTSCIVRPVEA